MKSETGQSHGDIAHDRHGNAVIVIGQAEAGVDGRRREGDQLLDSQRRRVAFDVVLGESQLLGQQVVDAFGDDDHRGVDFALRAVGHDAHHLAVLADEVHNEGLGDDERAFFLSLFRPPGIELGAQRHVGVNRLAVDFSTLDGGFHQAVFREEPEAGFGDGAFQRRFAIPKIGVDFQQGMGVERAAKIVLAAGVLSALDHGHLQAAARRNGRRRRTRQACADHNYIKNKFFVPIHAEPL